MANRTRKNQFSTYLSDKEMLTPDAKMEIAKKRSKADLIWQLIT